MKNSISLYWNIGSQPSRAAKALLDIGKISYTPVFVDLGKNQSRSPQYLQKNPLGQVPFIDDQGFGLGESNAIMVYLCQRYPEQLGKYYAEKLHEMARINQLLSWYQGFYRPALMGIIFLKKYRVKVEKLTFSENQLNIANTKQKKALNSFNERLEGRNYMVDNRLTILDLLFFFETSNLYYYGQQQQFDEFPNIKQWYNRIQEIPQVNSIQKQWREKTSEFKGFLDSVQPSPSL